MNRLLTLRKEVIQIYKTKEKEGSVSANQSIVIKEKEKNG